MSSDFVFSKPLLKLYFSTVISAEP